MALACLCAEDRHHQFGAETKPALCDGKVVICDRYVASSTATPAVIDPGFAHAAGTVASNAPRTTATWNPAATSTPWRTCRPRDGRWRRWSAPPTTRPRRTASRRGRLRAVPRRHLGKTDRKKAWIVRFGEALKRTASDESLVVLGDLNVLEPSHQPAHRSQFAQFEYDFYTGLTKQHDLADLFRHLHPELVEHSWARRPELGYRYDHAHGSPAVVKRLMACDYVHETMELAPDGTRLTDHSGLAVRLSLSPNRTLLTSDPATAVDAHNEPEPTLF